MSRQQVAVSPFHAAGKSISGMSWAQAKQAVAFPRAEERPLFVAGQGEPLQDYKAIVNKESGQTMHVAGANYGLVQHDDIAEAIMTAAGPGIGFEVAGSLDNGARGWLLARLGDPIRVRGDSNEILKYALGYNSLDGSGAAQILGTPYRPTCQNVLMQALRVGSSLHWRIRHTASAPERVKEAGIALARIIKGYEKFGELANMLAVTRFSDAQFKATLDLVMPVPVDDKPHTRIAEERGSVLDLWHGRAKGISGIQGTAWGALQAWTEYVDHFRQARGLPEGSKERLSWMLAGPGSTMKSDATSAVYDIAGVPAAEILAIR